MEWQFYLIWKWREIGAWLNLSAHIQNEIGAFSSNFKYSKIFLSQIHDCVKSTGFDINTMLIYLFFYSQTNDWDDCG